MKRTVWIRSALVRRSAAAAPAAERPARKSEAARRPFTAGKPGRPRKSSG